MALAAASGVPVWAQSASERSVHLLVGYAPGGPVDAMARIFAPAFAQALGQTVIVENKPGASGTIAAGQVARATPDGSLLLVDASSFAVNPALFNKLNAMTDKLDALVATLNNGEGTAGQLLKDKQLYENMNGAVGDLRALVADIRKDPRKFLNIKVSVF